MARPPKVNDKGERLAPVAVKVYPSDWKDFGRAVGDRSADLRKHMQRTIKRAKAKKVKPR